MQSDNTVHVPKEKKKKHHPGLQKHTRRHFESFPETRLYLILFEIRSERGFPSSERARFRASQQLVFGLPILEVEESLLKLQNVSGDVVDIDAEL